MGIRVREGFLPLSGVIQMVSYLGHPGFPKGELHGWGRPGFLSGCLVSNCVPQLGYVYLRWCL